MDKDDFNLHFGYAFKNKEFDTNFTFKIPDQNWNLGVEAKFDAGKKSLGSWAVGAGGKLDEDISAGIKVSGGDSVKKVNEVEVFAANTLGSTTVGGHLKYNLGSHNVEVTGGAVHKLDD